MADWKSALAALGAAGKDETHENRDTVGRRKRTGVVFSTNPDYEYSNLSTEVQPTLPRGQQRLHLSMERAGRGGKTVTIVRGFVGAKEDIAALCQLLKRRCGVGGTAKGNEIIIQGDHRQRIMEILREEGYKA